MSIPAYIANEIVSLPLYSEEEKQELFTAMGNGDLIARQKLIEAHMRLALKIANSYATDSVDVSDLFAEGCIGITKALTKYDPTKGIGMEYYIGSYIKGYIKQYLYTKGRVVRIPANWMTMYNQIKPMLSVDKDLTAEEVRGIAKRYNITEYGVLVACNGDTAVAFDDDTVLTEPYSVRNDPLEFVCRLQDPIKLSTFVEELPWNEQYILKCKYGGFDLTITECAEFVGLGYERTRQLEKKAITTLQKLIGGINDYC